MKNKEEENTKITGFLEALDLVMDEFKSGYITEQEMLEMIIMISSIRNFSTPTIDKVIRLSNTGGNIDNVPIFEIVDWIRKDVTQQQKREEVVDWVRTDGVDWIRKDVSLEKGEN